MLRIAISLFLTGIFLGAGPCLASCGPLLISYIAANAKSPRQALWYWFVFSIARIFVYVIFGIFLGIFGEFFLHHIYPTHIGRYILISGCVFIVGIGIVMLLKNKPQPKICSSNTSIFVFGLTLGVIPCAPILGILS